MWTAVQTKPKAQAKAKFDRHALMIRFVKRHYKGLYAMHQWVESINKERAERLEAASGS
ncbi:hypothetical protein [Paenibacillus ginsengarvi]|nr:hypothetical protein [Paenibacillus ginsengarvi]